jgi:hypothetical protein
LSVAYHIAKTSPEDIKKMTDGYEIPSDWKHCTPGDPMLRKRFPLLATLHLPFGTTIHDKTCRSGILLELLKLNETLGFSNEITSANGRGQTTVMKIPRMKNPDVVRLHRSRFIDTLLESMVITGNKEEAAEVLSGYLAKHNNKAFCSAIEVAQKVEKSNKKAEPSIAPADVIMYDGGSRDAPFNVNWNIRYHELLGFKRDYGHCLVPSRPNNKKAIAHEKYLELMRWVSQQRTSYNTKAPGMTPKRIELLEAVGFVWTVNPDMYKAHLDPRFYKAIAAKLLYNITARDSMLLSGMSDEEAANDNRKKLLNARVCNFYKEEFKSKSDVQAIMNTLKETVSDEDGLSSVFGASEILSSLCREGKFLPREQQDEASDPESSEYSDDAVDNRKRAPHAAPPVGTASKRSRALPLANNVSWM